MQHDSLFQQERVAHVYQLGTLEAEYTTDLKKTLANFGFALVFLLLALLLVLGISPLVIPTLIFGFLLGFLVEGSILFGLYRAYRHLQVYVYTNGLFYSNGARRRVVYWPQVGKASLYWGYLVIAVKNESSFTIPMYVFSYIFRSRELRNGIRRKIANSRTLG